MMSMDEKPRGTAAGPSEGTGRGPSFASVVSGAWTENRLFSVLLELTYRCNLDCFYCYNDLGKRGMLVPLERYLSLLDEIREQGALVLTLSGGEPLLHPGFWQIATRASDLAFSVRVKTNGHGWTQASIRRLKEEVSPFRVEISLHGGRAETHDRQTRVAGSFDRLMGVLSHLSDEGVRVKLNCTLTAWNAGELEEMAQIAESRGLSLAFNTTVSPRDNGDPTPLMVAPSADDLRRFHEFVQARGNTVEIESEPDEIPGPSATRKNCGAGSATLAIDPFGSVYPCVQWRRPVGNICHQTLTQIWSANARLDEIRALSVTARGVRDSLPSLSRSGFCMGLAEVYTGDPASPYSQPDVPRMSSADELPAGRPARTLALLPSLSNPGRQEGFGA